MSNLTISSHKLSIDGLSIAYTIGDECNSLYYDPKATCDLFEDLHIIDGWDIDNNLEPVILFEREHDFEDEEGNIRWTSRTVSNTWCDFVSSFNFNPRYAEIIAEHIESSKAHERLIKKINNLLAPLNEPQPSYSPLNAA